MVSLEYDFLPEASNDVQDLLYLDAVAFFRVR